MDLQPESVLKALEKDRERRYPSAEDLRRDLKRLLKGESITARPPSAAYRFKIFVRRHKVLVAVAAAVLVALVAGLITITSLYLRSREARTAIAINDFFNEMIMALSPLTLHLVELEKEEGEGGIDTSQYSKEDYVSVIPWFGVVLIGIFIGQTILRNESLQSFLSVHSDHPLMRGLAFAGRHSLLIYILHQPILFAILWPVWALNR